MSRNVYQQGFLLFHTGRVPDGYACAAAQFPLQVGLDRSFIDKDRKFVPKCILSTRIFFTYAFVIMC